MEANLAQNSALALFTELLSVPSPSGHEQRVAQIIRGKLDAWGYAHGTDAMGSVLVRLAGRNPDAPLCCIAAHMDEIGIAVGSIEPDGSLRVIRSGGLLPSKIGERPVEILGDKRAIVGIIAMGSGHATGAGDKAISWDDVRILTGLSPAELEAAGIRPGAPGVPSREGRGPIVFGNPEDPLVGAWTFDDRMGVVALLRLLEAVQREGIQPYHPTLVAFTAQEEVGGHGAKAVAMAHRPGTFVAIDGCPMPPGAPLALDGRPGVWTRDRLSPYDPGLIYALMQAAEAAGTMLQPVAYDSAFSDAGAVLNAGAAPRVVCMGHVRANSHGYEVARLSVFDNVLRALLRFVSEWEG